MVKQININDIKHYSCFHIDCWHTGKLLTIKNVKNCLSKGIMINNYDWEKTQNELWLNTHISHVDMCKQIDYVLKLHAARTAWLVKHKSLDPIIIYDINDAIYKKSKPDWLNGGIVTDGCHRLAAAIIRGDKTILAETYRQHSMKVRLKIWITK